MLSAWRISYVNSLICTALETLLLIGRREAVCLVIPAYLPGVLLYIVFEQVKMNGAE